MTKRTIWQLLWRHYRTLLLSVIGIQILVGIREGITVLEYRLIPRGGFTFASVSGWRLAAAALIFFAVGLAVFLMDTSTHFNQYLFSLPVARRKIFRVKMGLITASLVSGYLLMEVAYGLVINNRLAKYHAYWDWSVAWKLELVQLSMLLALSLLGMTFGLWLGHLLAGVIFGTGFACSLVFAYDALNRLVAAALGVSVNQARWLESIDARYWPGLVLAVGLLWLVSVGLYGLDAWAFDHLSIENDREFFRFPSLRPVALWFSIIYLMITISCSQFGLGLLQLLTNQYYEVMPLSLGIVMAILVGYGTWGLGRWFLYRPDHFRRAWTMKKIS